MLGKELDVFFSLNLLFTSKIFKITHLKVIIFICYEHVLLIFVLFDKHLFKS